MLTGRTDSKMLNVNYLRTRKTYGDYALEFDYRVPTGNANSRVLIRTEKRDDPVQAGIEIRGDNLGGHPITNHVVGGQNKFNRPLKEFAREDFIGFQDHGTPAEYRNIRIKELGD
jgi:hypothetical protein